MERVKLTSLYSLCDSSCANLACEAVLEQGHIFHLVCDFVCVCVLACCHRSRFLPIEWLCCEGLTVTVISSCNLSVPFEKNGNYFITPYKMCVRLHRPERAHTHSYAHMKSILRLYMCLHHHHPANWASTSLACCCTPSTNSLSGFPLLLPLYAICSPAFNSTPLLFIFGQNSGCTFI